MQYLHISIHADPNTTLSLSLSLYVYIYICPYIYTHTHLHTRLYVWTYIISKYVIHLQHYNCSFLHELDKLKIKVIYLNLMYMHVKNSSTTWNEMKKQTFLQVLLIDRNHCQQFLI
jgi:hypothetical protein